MFDDVDSILYALNVLSSETEEDQYYIGLIAGTILRLPEEHRERVLKEVVFILSGGTSGEYFPVYVQKRFMIHCIVINSCSLNNQSEALIMSAIAHEIAHYVLGHRVSGLKIRDKEADDLIYKWGFREASA